MNNQVKYIAKQFDLQNRLFKNAIEGLNEKNGERINEFTNHAAWISGHVVSARYNAGAVLGLKATQLHPELFDHGSSIDPTVTYPSAESTLADFEAISNLIIEELNKTTDETMQQKAPMPCPLGDTIGDLFAFFAHHEAYHIGQLGILRKYFGNEAMSYS